MSPPGKMEKYRSELSEFYLKEMTKTNSRFERELITIKPTIKHLKLASPYSHLTLKSFFFFFLCDFSSTNKGKEIKNTTITNEVKW